MIQSRRNHVFKQVVKFLRGFTDFVSSLISTNQIRMLTTNMMSATYIKTLIVPICSSKVGQSIVTTGTRNLLTQSQILMLIFHLWQNLLLSRIWYQFITSISSSFAVIKSIAHFYPSTPFVARWTKVFYFTCTRTTFQRLRIRFRFSFSDISFHFGFFF